MMCGLNVTLKATLTDNELNEMSYIGEAHNMDKNPNCRVFYDIDKEFFRKTIVKSVNIQATVTCLGGSS